MSIITKDYVLTEHLYGLGTVLSILLFHLILVMTWGRVLIVPVLQISRLRFRELN